MSRNPTLRLVFSLKILTSLMLSMSAVAERTSITPVPPLDSPHVGDFTAARREITGGPWTMGQAWRAAPENGLRPGIVRFGWTPDALWILAELADEHVASRSTRHNLDMWALGDVFEVFIARRGSPRYLELHVTPNNHRLHLRWTGRDLDKVRQKLKTVADFRADPDAFQSWVSCRPDGSGWQVLTRIPAAIFTGDMTFRAGQKFAFSFSRYDAGPKATPDILSSTSPHRKPNYHRRHEWRTVVLAP